MREQQKRVAHKTGLIKKGLNFMTRVSFFLALIFLGLSAFSQTVERRQEVASIERAGRPTLRKGVTVLYPFTFLNSRGGRWTVYMPANQIQIFSNGNVSYKQVTRFGDVEMSGHLDTEDFLMPVKDQKLGSLRVGQEACLRVNTLYFPAGSQIYVERFYEQGYLLAKSGDLFDALEGRRFAFRWDELGPCQKK